MNKNEKISSIILCITGVVIVVDTVLEQFFNIGTKQNNLVIGYCIGFMILSVKFPIIIKNKYVIIPIYLMILQMLYSLINTFILN